MGAACCVAARDKTLPNRTSSEFSHRNVRYSPSWSFRWDNRTHIEDGIDHAMQHSCGNSRDIGLGYKSRPEEETEPSSDGGSSVEKFKTISWQKSPVSGRASGDFRAGASDVSMESISVEEKDIDKSSAVANLSSPKTSISLPSTSSTFRAEPSSSHGHLFPSFRTPPRLVRHSPSYQLSRQVSDSRVLGFRSPSNNSVSEGRQSFVMSVCSNDLTSGSHCGSSDGWSMRTFSELVASSQRERWSLDSENMSINHIKITRSSSNSPLSNSPSMDLQTCGICLKLLTDRSPWSSQKIISSNELSVVAVLVCGHVYHGDCLENKTPEADRYDPSCPLCNSGVKFTSRMTSKKASRSEAETKSRNKISRIGVVDSDDIDGESVPSLQKRNHPEGKGPKMGASSSMKSSFGKPFLRRHFSLGSKSTRVQMDSETRKKGFWMRYRKE